MSKKDINRWYDEGLRMGFLYMSVYRKLNVYYPYYVRSANEYTETTTEDLGVLLEVYDLTVSKNLQMSEVRAYHPPRYTNSP
jgi:hypothetical protein